MRCNRSAMLEIKPDKEERVIMQEIKCPKCGEVFAVDESDYAQIVQQVRDKEFDKELKQREKNLEEMKEKDLMPKTVEAVHTHTHTHK